MCTLFFNLKTCEKKKSLFRSPWLQHKKNDDAPQAAAKKKQEPNVESNQHQNVRLQEDRRQQHPAQRIAEDKGQDLPKSGGSQWLPLYSREAYSPVIIIDGVIVAVSVKQQKDK